MCHGIGIWGATPYTVEACQSYLHRRPKLRVGLFCPTEVWWLCAIDKATASSPFEASLIPIHICETPELLSHQCVPSVQPPTSCSKNSLTEATLRMHTAETSAERMNNQSGASLSQLRLPMPSMHICDS